MSLNENQLLTVNKIRGWQESCLRFAVEELGQSPDPWQIKLYNAFSSRDPKMMRIAMQACKGVGKTTALATIGLNFLAAYGEKGEHPKGAATSITEDNIDDNLWPEISKWMQRSEYLSRAFKWTKTRVFAVDHPETWFLSKRTWAKGADPTKQASTLAGLHSKFLLFLVDESGDVPDAVFAAADAGLTGTESGRFQKLVQAGNPTKREGPLWRASSSERDLWYVIEITGDPDDPQRSQRQNIDWARDQIRRYGKDSPWVLVNVFGKFPETSINALISDELVEKSFTTIIRPDAYQMSQKRIGVDVARFGDDFSVMFPRQGLRAFNFVEENGMDSMELADRLITSKLKWGSELEFVDGTGGFGSGVIDSMTQRGYNPIEVHFAAKATNPRFANKRAEMYFRSMKWLKNGGQLPRDERLKKELCATTYTMKNGRFILSPKEIIKSHLGFSPDRADAFVLTFAQAEQQSSRKHPLEIEQIRGHGGKAVTKWNPYARQ